MDIQLKIIKFESLCESIQQQKEELDNLYMEIVNADLNKQSEYMKLLDDIKWKYPEV